MQYVMVCACTISLSLYICTHHIHTHTHIHTQNEVIEPFLGGLRTHPFPSLGTETLSVVPVGVDTGQVGQLSTGVGYN